MFRCRDRQGNYTYGQWEYINGAWVAVVTLCHLKMRRFGPTRCPVPNDDILYELQTEDVEYLLSTEDELYILSGR